MIRARLTVSIFSVLLSFHCFNGKYLLLETEDKNEMSNGGDAGMTSDGESSGAHSLGSSEDDLTENKAVNRKDNCDFCEPDTPGGWYGIG